jgi:hypothetical protein
MTTISKRCQADSGEVHCPVFFSINNESWLRIVDIK